MHCVDAADHVKHMSAEGQIIRSGRSHSASHVTYAFVLGAGILAAIADLHAPSLLVH